MDKEEKRIRILELTIDSFARIADDDPTSHEITERAQIFTSYINGPPEIEQPEEREDMPGPPCNCDKCRDLRLTSNNHTKETGDTDKPIIGRTPTY